MHLVERMNPDLGAPQCLTCGKGNTPGNDGRTIGPFLDLDREVNWGDPAYICGDCGTQIGGYFDMITADDKQDFEARIKELERLNHELGAKLDQKQRRVEAAELKLSTVVNAKKILKKEREKAA